MNAPDPPSLANWLDTINSELGTAFEQDEPGRAFIAFDDNTRVGIDFPDGAHSYVIYTPIGLLNQAAELPRLLVALQLNLYQRATAGGVIGLDMMSGSFVYSFRHPVAHSSPAILAQQLDQFVEHAQRLREQLEQVADDPEHAELDALAQTLGMVSEGEAAAIEDAADTPSSERLEDPPPNPAQRGLRV